MNKQPEVTDATRNAFIDAFCTLALEKPIGSIRLVYSRRNFDEIVRTLGN